MLGLVQASLLRREGTSVFQIGIGAKIWTLVSRLVLLASFPGSLFRILSRSFGDQSCEQRAWERG